jgi:UDPglucose--hexose-1-phosphate uridylyltransferase
MSELRQDAVTGRWVIIAAERSKRPGQIGNNRAPAPSPPCPFCPGNEALTPPEIFAQRPEHTRADAPGWQIRVVPNTYPALEDSGTLTMNQHGIYRSMNGLGAHEVIIESPEHIVDMGMLSADQLANVLRVYRARMRALRRDPRWRYLLLYKNHGERAGASLEHVHSQLIALPTLPKETSGELDGVERHFESTGRCIYCETIEREVERGERLVLNSERFAALCPFAPRFAYESWILPKNHGAVFEESQDKDIVAFARILHELIARLNRALDQPPFNYVIHSIPPQSESNHYHWHMKILPRLAHAAGFEWGSGCHMNSVAPEDAARLLRNPVL